MATLADVPLQDVPGVLERIDSRLLAETRPPEAAKMMASALTLAGMRLDFDVVEALRGRLRTMNILKDSSFYQVLLKEGREVGQREGEIKGVRKTLIHLGRIRFGRLPRATRAAIEAIDDLERLELPERAYPHRDELGRPAGRRELIPARVQARRDDAWATCRPAPAPRRGRASAGMAERFDSWSAVPTSGGEIAPVHPIRQRAVVRVRPFAREAEPVEVAVGVRPQPDRVDVGSIKANAVTHAMSRRGAAPLTYVRKWLAVSVGHVI